MTRKGGGGQPHPPTITLLRTPEDSRADFMLTRLLQWAGTPRESFNIVTLDPDTLSFVPDTNIVVPMGAGALEVLTGRRDALSLRGYVWAEAGYYLLPTVSPDFILRGQSRYASAFINDIQKAVKLAEHGLPVELTDYNRVDMLPTTAMGKAQEYLQALRRYPLLPLAADIETPYASDDESERDDDDSWNIERISFSWGPFQAISLPFTGPYMAAIRQFLDAAGPMVTWNGDNFDNPRLKRAGFALNRPLFDAMVAWHVLHSDLPKGLGFVATFTCPWQPAWKHLSSREPVYYSCVDADVTWRSYDVIQADLKQVPGLWEAYDRDVIQLNPRLRKMEAAGMPVDHEIRLDRAQKLTQKLNEVAAEIHGAVPPALHRYSPAAGYVRAPSSTEGLVEIEVEAVVKRCGRCGLINPTKPHFKVTKKVANPCAGAEAVEATETITRWAEPLLWVPSSKALMEYQTHHHRPIPQKYDKKTGTRKPSMDKKGIKQCQRKYPDDRLYPLILQHRELQKIAGTYIGYVEGD